MSVMEEGAFVNEEGEAYSRRNYKNYVPEQGDHHVILR